MNPMGNGDDGRGLRSNGSPGVVQAGSPWSGHLARRAMYVGADGSTAAGVRRMQQFFGTEANGEAPAQGYFGGMSQYNGAAPNNAQSPTLQYANPMQTGGRQTAIPRNSSSQQYLILDRQGEDALSEFSNSANWRSRSAKVKKSRGRRWLVSRWRLLKETEKILVFIFLVVGCFMMSSTPKLLSKYSDERERKGLEASVERNLTHLTVQEVLQLEESERINSRVHPRVISELKLAEWSNSRLEAVQPRVSLIAACKDRTSSLFETLPTWQAALGPTDEIIVIDWSTSKDLLSVYDHMKTLRDPRLFCARVQDQDKWILSLAYNYAAQFANGNFILKVDCDTKLHPKFLEQHPLEEAENTFYRVAWTKTRDENEQHLSGVLFTPRKHFEEVRGYDERIQSYGWDDSDLYKRLEEMQVTAKDIDLEYARHIEHEDVIRAADQDDLESPMFHTQLNSLLIAEVPSWSLAWMNEHAEYDTILKTQNGSFAEASVSKSVKSLESLVSPQKVREAEKTAYGRVLNKVYGIPWGVLSEVNGDLADVMASVQQVGSLTEWRKHGAIFAEVRGTAADRMLALTSLVALTVKHDRVLFVAWGGDGKKSAMSDHPESEQVSSFFDWEKSGVDGKDIGARSITSMYAINRLKCSTPSSCAAGDPAWEKVVSSVDEADMMMTLRGMLPGKQHVLVKVNGTLRGLTNEELLRAYNRLVPSTALLHRIRKYGDTSNKVGVFLGTHLRRKQLSALSSKLKDTTRPNSIANLGEGFLVVGSSQSEVEGLRRDLGTFALESEIDPETETAHEKLVREFAELYALSRTKMIVHEGRYSQEVKDLLQLWNSDKRERMPRVAAGGRINL